MVGRLSMPRSGSEGRGEPFSVAVAPMMAWTDRHCRYFLRLLSPDARLYTEMVSARALLHGDRERLLGFDQREHPVALQIGGSEPEVLARAARIGSDFGYDEINLNVGCPSEKVSAAAFGACLMKQPALVADCVAAMRAAAAVPVTVKTRIGVDDQEGREFLAGFVETVAAAGCRTFVVHARKALLKGLSPAENRSVPPLRYEAVYALKRAFPELRIIINGGIDSEAAVLRHRSEVDGVMIGRRAYADPYLLARLQTLLLNPAHGRAWEPPDRRSVVEAMIDYARGQQSRGVRLPAVTRHMAGLLHGRPGARAWRQRLNRESLRSGASADSMSVALRAAGLA